MYTFKGPPTHSQCSKQQFYFSNSRYQRMDSSLPPFVRSSGQRRRRCVVAVYIFLPIPSTSYLPHHPPKLRNTLTPPQCSPCRQKRIRCVPDRKGSCNNCTIVKHHCSAVRESLPPLGPPPEPIRRNNIPDITSSIPVQDPPAQGSSESSSAHGSNGNSSAQTATTAA